MLSRMSRERVSRETGRRETRRQAGSLASYYIARRDAVGAARSPRLGKYQVSGARRYYISNWLAEDCSNELAAVTEQKIWPRSLVHIASNLR